MLVYLYSYKGVRNVTNSDFFPKKKQIIAPILIVVGMVLLGNTNNNPISFIERILIPIEIGSGTLYYANLFSILLIYYGLKGIYQNKGYSFLKTRGRRILATMLVLLLSMQLSNYGIKLHKSTTDDLNSIYYHRDKNSDGLKLEQKEDGKIIITCSIELENCSSNPQTFYMNLIIPEFFQESIVQKELIAIEDNSGKTEKFILHGKERKRIDAVFSGKGKNKDSAFNGSSTRFEFSLFNDEQKVEFTQPRL